MYGGNQAAGEIDFGSSWREVPVSKPGSSYLESTALFRSRMIWLDISGTLSKGVFDRRSSTGSIDILHS